MRYDIAVQQLTHVKETQQPTFPTQIAPQIATNATNQITLQNV